MFLPVLASQSRIVLVPTSTCDSVCIRRKRHAVDRIRMPSEGAYVSAGVYIPEPDCVAITTTCDSVCMRSKRHAEDRRRMPGERVRMFLPVLASQSRIVSSKLPLAIVFP